MTWPWLSSPNQMKHIQQENEQHCRYRSDASISTEMFTQVSLNESEYPKLGQKNIKIESIPDLFVFHHESVITETVIPYVTKKAKHQKLLGLHKHKRSEKLFLDLNKALEVSINIWLISLYVKNNNFELNLIFRMQNVS